MSKTLPLSVMRRLCLPRDLRRAGGEPSSGMAYRSSAVSAVLTVYDIPIPNSLGSLSNHLQSF